MIGVKKCLFYALSFVLLSTNLSILFSASAYAVSDYDDIVELTPYVTLIDGEVNKDISNSWFTAFRDGITFDEDFSGSFCFQGNQYHEQTFKDQITTAVDQGTFILTTQEYQDNQQIRLTYTTDPDAYLGFETINSNNILRMYSQHNIASIIMTVNPAGTSFSTTECSVIEQTPQTKSIVSSNEPTYTKRIIMSPMSITYPSGYAGQQIPAGLLETPRPEINLEIRDKTIKATYKGNLKPTAFLNWHIEKESDDSTVLDWDIERKTILNYTFTNYDDYRLVLRAEYLMPQPSPYDSANYTQPPYFLVISLPIDGSNKDIDTSLCQGFSAECPDLLTSYENCDILDINCHVRNVFTALARWLGIESTPSNPTGSPFVNFTNNSYGLTAVLTAPLLILGNISTAQYTCTPISLPVPYAGGSYQLPCLYQFYQNTFGDAFLMYQAIISGIVTYYALTKVFNITKRAINPYNNRIEVLKL